MTRLQLNQRAGAAVMPKIHLIDLKIAQKQNGMSQSLIDEIQKRLDKKEQVLVFLNRRGYAPVLICESCAWQAKCPHCDANFYRASPALSAFALSPLWQHSPSAGAMPTVQA